MDILVGGFLSVMLWFGFAILYLGFHVDSDCAFLIGALTIPLPIFCVLIRMLIQEMLHSRQDSQTQKED